MNGEERRRNDPQMAVLVIRAYMGPMVTIGGIGALVASLLPLLEE